MILDYEIVGHKYENEKSLEEEILEKLMKAAMVPEDYLYSRGSDINAGKDRESI